MSRDKHGHEVIPKLLPDSFFMKNGDQMET